MIGLILSILGLSLDIYDVIFQMAQIGNYFIFPKRELFMVFELFSILSFTVAVLKRKSSRRFLFFNLCLGTFYVIINAVITAFILFPFDDSYYGAPVNYLWYDPAQYPYFIEYLEIGCFIGLVMLTYGFYKMWKQKKQKTAIKTL